MRIMICDDEAPIRELLKAKLERYFFPRSIEFSIQTCESGEALLKRDLSQIDVLLLDVDMPGMSGMETAAEVRKTDQQLLIVFLTAYSEFVFESFKVDAFRYLLKPLKDAELDEVLQAVQQRLYAGDGECLNFQFQNETYHIRYSDILYIEGMRDKIWLHCKDGDHRWRGAMVEGPRWIKLKAGKNLDDTLIYVQNAVAPTREKRSLRTGKKDKHLHGIGMTSIQECAEKYKGYVSIIEEKDTFQLAILFGGEQSGEQK